MIGIKKFIPMSKAAKCTLNFIKKKENNKNSAL